MKYNSQLIEATLLKRPISFLVEAVLQSKRRIMLRCPNLYSLNGCDILGTQLWFSAPSRGHCLPTLELVEVNGGFLVGINPEILKDLLIDSIQQKNIQELFGYKILEDENSCQLEGMQTLSLSHGSHGRIYLCLEHIMQANDQLEALFPINNQDVNAHIDYLVLRRKQGHRSILMFCILHSGVKSLRIVESKSLYIGKMQYAMQQGVEFFAYKAEISTQEINLNTKLAINIQAIARL